MTDEKGKKEGWARESKRMKRKRLILGNYLVKPHFAGEETSLDMIRFVQAYKPVTVLAGEDLPGFRSPGLVPLSSPMPLEAAPIALLNCNHEFGLSSCFSSEEFEKALQTQLLIEGVGNH